MMFGWVPFSGEKRVKLFRRALPEVIKGWRLLALTASTRSMSEFCAAVYWCVCYTCVQHEHLGIHTENTAYDSSTLRLFCIADRYQVSGVRYCSYSQYLDYCLFSGLSATMRVQYAPCSRSNLGVTASCCLLRYRTYRCCCCAAAGVAAGSAQQQLQQPTAAAAMPATTPAAAAVGASFDVVPLLLSFSCVGEAISSAKAPFEVGTARRR